MNNPTVTAAIEATDLAQADTDIVVIDPLAAFDEAVRDLKRELRKHLSQHATIDGLYAQVAELRSTIAEAALDGRDADVQENSRVLRNLNNRIDRLIDNTADDDTITAKKAAVSAALEAL